MRFKNNLYESITKPFARGIEFAPLVSSFVVVRVDHLGIRRYDFVDSSENALCDLFGEFAWPGGYPIVWHDANGDALCPACARVEYEACEDFTIACHEGRASASIYEGTSEDHGVIDCENCNRSLVAA